MSMHLHHCNNYYVTNKDIIQFQIPIDDSPLVQEVQCQTNLCRVEPGMLLWQSALPLHVEHQVPSPHELNDKEQPGRRLEARVQTHEERVVGSSLEHMLLCLDPVYVFIVGHQFFLDDLMKI